MSANVRSVSVFIVGFFGLTLCFLEATPHPLDTQPYLQIADSPVVRSGTATVGDVCPLISVVMPDSRLLIGQFLIVDVLPDVPTLQLGLVRPVGELPL